MIKKTVNYDLLKSGKLYQERARLTLPYLVRQAKAGQTIYYSDLAEQIGVSRPINLNYILGYIGKALIGLEERTKIQIPPIQCVVINKQQKLPGEGISWFISATEFSKLNKTQKQKILSVELAKIYTFQGWDWVLQQFGLNSITTNLEDKLEEAKIGRSNGESEQHKKFKEFISKNPSILGLSATLKNGKQEYPFPTTDTIDVLFIDNELRIGVEVKSNISNTIDILRGIFQCVKYKHLIEAEQIIDNKLPNSRVILAMQGKLPDELILVKNLLGIEVIDEIRIN